MNEPRFAKSPNRLPIHNDWQRYDSPTVFRKHGREFLERQRRPFSEIGAVRLHDAVQRRAGP